MIDNPYAPPSANKLEDVVAVDAQWYLARVQKYFRRMAIVGLVYVGFVFTVALVTQLLTGTLEVLGNVGPLVGFALLTWTFVTMFRIGKLPADQFPRHYTTARWVAILAGSIFLPVLGLPAFISLRRLSRYYAIRSAPAQRD